jgi:thiamine pyrophosphate-dependent acetolactate synthase large subunit-like protein
MAEVRPRALGADVAEAIGADIAAAGAEHAFGLLGSGNFVIGQALAAAGVVFHAARHETAAVCMADGYARATGRVGVCTVHHGPGFTNALTGLAEAVKSATPLLLITGDVPRSDPHSNFAVDQALLASGVGAAFERAGDPATARSTASRAFDRALLEQRPVVLSVATDIQAQPAVTDDRPLRPDNVPAVAPDPASLARACTLVAAGERVVVLAGRGAVRAGAQAALVALADATDGFLATTAAAAGLFEGHPGNLGIAGGFGSPVARRLLAEADVIIAAGASLNRWTTHHGTVITPATRIVQIDVSRAALGRQVPVDHAICGDARLVAEAMAASVPRRGRGYRATVGAEELGAGDWASQRVEPAGASGRIDPGTLCVELQERLPTERTIVIDSGHFMAYPAMYLKARDPAGFVFSQGFMSVGLGLACAIGAGTGRPERVTLLAIGDGGLLMSLGELETLIREKLAVIVVVFNDAAYGAEVHDFRPLGYATDLVRFPETDFAAVAAALGCASAIVRDRDDLRALDSWLQHPCGPLLLDARVDGEKLAEAWL